MNDALNNPTSTAQLEEVNSMTFTSDITSTALMHQSYPSVAMDHFFSDTPEIESGEIPHQLQHDVNPLIACAVVLFVRVFQLTQLKASPDKKQLYQELVDYVKQFEQKAADADYHPHIILAARYILCAWVDESIEYTSWNTDNSWGQGNLVKNFQGESWGGERFFSILSRGLASAKWYMDLLELIYLCLSFGFKGKYRMDSEGDVRLMEIRDHLYHTLRKQRGEFSKSLVVGVSEVICAVPTKTTRRYSLLLAPVFACALVAGIFFSIHHFLGEMLTPLYQKLAHILS